MKKPITIVFLTIYLMLSIGVTLSLHFCGDSLTSVKMLPFASQSGRCGCDDTTIPDGCCKTEIKSIQLNDDQLGVQTEQAASPQTDVAIRINEPTVSMYASESIQQVFPTDSPPASTPSYIIQRALLI